MSEKEHENDSKEVAEESSLEIYLRFNGDMEKDYCLQITSATRFRDLFRLFDTLPISLRPSIFYASKPVSFVVSTAPGYLTEDGALLFSYETAQEKYQKRVGLDDIIAKKCWPGQLVLPVWEFNYFGYYSFITALLVWLYTDLPDFVSPTPGLCLTNQMSYVLAWASQKYGFSHIADVFIKDLQEPVNIGAQCVFFLFHMIKVLGIFIVAWSGLFNPIQIFRLPQKKPDITKESLIELGWTGSKRANADEYKEAYREYKISELGGMVRAHQAGLFTKLKHLGVFLGDNEGFNTPIDPSNKLSDITDEKFVLSYEYFVKQGEFFEQFIAGKSADEINTLIKQFRRYGLMHSGGVLPEYVEKRKAVGDTHFI